MNISNNELLNYLLIVLVGLGVIWTVYFVNTAAKNRRNGAKRTGQPGNPTGPANVEKTNPANPRVVIGSSGGTAVDASIARDEVPSLDRLFAERNDMWVCGRCETLNRNQVSVCAACGAARRK